MNNDILILCYLHDVKVSCVSVRINFKLRIESVRFGRGGDGMFHVLTIQLRFVLECAISASFIRWFPD